MTKPRPCGCKGCRTCLICETQFGADSIKLQLKLNRDNSYVYCPLCNKAWKGWDMDLYKEHPNHSGHSIDYPGVYIKLDFIDSKEEELLVKSLDEIPWDISQSGRRKQNFGPKTNFKKRKVANGNFEGFPLCTKFLQDRFNDIGLMKGYETIEQCSLEYDPSKGASIDPHIDDCWIWGERIVTVNCLSDSVLTMTPYVGNKIKYNLKDAESYNTVVKSDGRVNLICHASEETNALKASCPIEVKNDIVIRIPMPRNSLLVFYGEPRYHWEHSVLREDITSRRVCIAYREFTPPYMSGGQHEQIGSVIREKSKLFWDHKIKITTYLHKFSYKRLYKKLLSS